VFRETMWLRCTVARCMSVVVASFLVAAIAGCAPSQSVTSTTPLVPESSTTGAPPSIEPTTTGPSPSPSTVSTTTITSPATTSITVPPVARPIGESYDFYVPTPVEGAIVGVVGVRYDDMLNLRSGPDVTFDVVATLEPTLAGIAGTGEGWQLPTGSVWWKVNADGVVGWANHQFLSRLGGVDDLTSYVVGNLGKIPVAQTMLDLGLIVANTIADVDNRSDVVVSVSPTLGNLGEVTYDVVGLEDDSVGGYRLHIFGQPTEGDGSFSLVAVEATTMCLRAVSEDLCV